MPEISMDIVTVFHNDKNKRQALDLRDSVAHYAPDAEVHLVDNTKNNRGFAKGSNLGATWCTAPIIGFLNPDVEIRGQFTGRVIAALEDPDTVICGNRYRKTERELKIWGVKNFVCGACFFVDRAWFEEVGGFDERFIWSHEELDLIRQAETQGKRVVELQLPIRHESPTDDLEVDVEYKRYHFNQAALRYRKKWNR